MPARLTRLVLVLCAAAVVLGAPDTAQAQVGRGRDTGVGLEFATGGGAGLSFKHFLSSGRALQIGLNGSRYRKRHYGFGFYDDALWVHGELLETGGHLARSSAVDFVWYYGAGVSLGIGDPAAFGGHGDIGFAMQLQRAPFDFFIEWQPTLWIGEFGIDLVVPFFIGGIRLYF